MLHSAPAQHSNQNSKPKRPSLAQWIGRAVGLPGVRVKFRLQGNHLHLLCEGSPCPDRAVVLHHLLRSLKKTDINTLVPQEHPPIYQVVVGGRSQGKEKLTWVTSIHLDQLERHLAQLHHSQVHHSQASQPESPSTLEFSSPAQSKPTPTATTTATTTSTVRSASSASALIVSNRSLAKQGQTEAIARYLSETLSSLGIAVEVNAKTLPYPTKATSAAPVGGKAAAGKTPATHAVRRLWMTCEAVYSPEPAVIGEPIAQKLRDLELQGYRDALVLIQVRGEPRPDWGLRVDLTPPEEMLREWARWGDIEALTRLLNQALAKVKVRLSTASLQDSTLHLFCACSPGVGKQQPSAAEPDQQAVREAVIPLLERLAPQGIHAATLYGQAAEQVQPIWVDWLNLPAAEHPALADSTLALAQSGDLQAIAFLLNRLLNPNLDKQLATGGTRIQLLYRDDLLHVMSDAPICPRQRRIGPAVVKFLRQLNISGLTGVRVYGRRAGQRRPLWSYGSDFETRSRLVPEAAPEFAATDVYVGDLIASSEELTIRPDLTPADLQNAWQRSRQWIAQTIQRSLLQAQLCVTQSEAKSLLPTKNKTDSASYQGVGVAIIWGAVGLLLTVQTDWLLGRTMQNLETAAVAETQSEPLPSAPAPSVQAETTAPQEVVDFPLPDLSLQQSSGDDTSVFDGSGFTQSGDAGVNWESLTTTSPTDPTTFSLPVNLPYTPEDSYRQRAALAALSDDLPYPTFNSRQLDQKLALYYQHLAESGPPDVLVIGSSRALRGVDPVALQQSLAGLGYADISIFNFGINGATAQVVDLIVRQMLTPDQLPKLIVWADGARALNSGRTDVTFNGIVSSDGYQQFASGTLPLPSGLNAQSPGTVGMPDGGGSALGGGLAASLTASYDSLDRWLSQRLAGISTVHEERDRLKALFQNSFATILPQPAPQRLTLQPTGVPDEESAGEFPISAWGQEGMIDFNGFLSLSMRFNPATYYQKYARVAGSYDGDYEDFRLVGGQTQSLLALSQFTHTQNVPLIFVNLPLTDEYLDPVRMQHEQAFRQHMLELSVNQPGLIFRDLGQAWPTQHDYFSDPSHLNRYGAYEVSRRLAQDPMIPWGDAK